MAGRRIHLYIYTYTSRIFGCETGNGIVETGLNCLRVPRQFKLRLSPYKNEYEQDYQCISMRVFSFLLDVIEVAVALLHL